MSFKIAMLGLPGAGKGTQSQKLSEEYGIPAVSMGGLLRAEEDAVIYHDDEEEENRDLYRLGDAVVRTQEPEGLPEYVETLGQRLENGEGPSTDTSTYFLEKRLNQPDCEDGYVIDGFPRWREQAEAMDDIDTLDAVVYLDVSEDEIYRRLAERGRGDDTEDAIARRIAWQAAGMEKVFDHYADSPVPVETVDADPSIDAVWEDVQKTVEQYARDAQ